MSYGYNAGLAFVGTMSGVVEYATGMLDAISAKRQSLGTEQAPLIFICHSLGGILFKQVSTQARIDEDAEGLTL